MRELVDFNRLQWVKLIMNKKILNRVIFLLLFTSLTSCYGANSDLKKKYYDEIKEKCKENNCCLSSVSSMEKANGYQVENSFEKCKEGYRINMKKCISTLVWCEPI